MHVLMCLNYLWEGLLVPILSYGHSKEVIEEFLPVTQANILRKQHTLYLLHMQSAYCQQVQQETIVHS